MATLNKTVLEEVLVEDYFYDTIILIADSRIIGTPPNETTEYESLSFISLTANEDITELSSNNIASGEDLNINIFGNHILELFDQNVIKSIPRGSSDLIDIPLTSNGFDEIDPIENQVFSYIADQRTITVTFDLKYNSSFDGINNISFTQQVSNDYSVGIKTLSSYI